MITIIKGPPGAGKTNLLNTLVRNGNQCVEIFEEMTREQLDMFKVLVSEINRPVYVTTQELTEEDFSGLKIKFIEL